MGRNILFIMYDQLRFDYLSCAGHPYLKTPNFDRLASRGVRFTQCYAQSTICGSSRMSTYTGRYVHSHGAAWNDFPLRVGEMTMGDHLRPLGMDCWLIGKTHMRADGAGMARLGLSADSVIGARQAECGFDVWSRDDGLWGEGPAGFYDERRSPYNEYLKSKGYPGNNPWLTFANAADENGQIASGWFMEHASKPANIDEQDSETPWLTREAIRFIEQARGSWCAHLSYIKPHWPYIVPAPYHDMYGPQHVQPVVRSEDERKEPHPIFAAFMENHVSKAFCRDEVREKVIPAYMGLVAQCDAELGRLLNYLEETGRDKDTVIVITSDHGDYLGDHWLGEKDMFHDPSVRIPLIVYDPSPEVEATRGTTCDALVESIDLLATFIEMAGGEIPAHVVEGRSLLPWLHGEEPRDWRDFVVSEYNYAQATIRPKLGVAAKDARLFMIADHRWKFIHAEGGFRPMLFDRESDPNEVCDLGTSQSHANIVDEMYDRLARWSRRDSQRVTISDAELERRLAGGPQPKGVLVGIYDDTEVDPSVGGFFKGPVPKGT